MPSKSSKRQVKIRSKLRDYCKIEDLSNVLASAIAKCYILKPISPFKFIADELYTIEGIALPETYANYNEIFDLKKELEYYKSLVKSITGVKNCNEMANLNENENFMASMTQQMLNENQDKNDTGIEAKMPINLSEQSEDDNDKNTKNEDKNEPLAGSISIPIPEINHTDTENSKDEMDHEVSDVISDSIDNKENKVEDEVKIDLKNNLPENGNEITEGTIKNSSDKPEEGSSYSDDDIRISEHTETFLEKKTNNTLKDTGCMVVIPSENLTENGLKDDPKSAKDYEKDYKNATKGKKLTSIQNIEMCSTRKLLPTEIEDVQENSIGISYSATQADKPKAEYIPNTEIENFNIVDDEIEEVLRRLHSVDNADISTNQREVDNNANEDLLSILINQPSVVISRISSYDTVMADSDDNTVKSLCIVTSSESDGSPEDIDTESNIKKEPQVESKMEMSNTIPEIGPVKKSHIPVSDILSLALEDELELDYETDDL